MSPRRFALAAAAALAVAFIAANTIANSWFRSWRLDLTQNQLYSLSRGTQQTLEALTEPVDVTLYYSRDAAAAAPQLQAYAARVREVLQTFEARSQGKIRVTEVNVEPVSDAEDAAMASGLQPRAPYQGADPIYFGLVGVNSVGAERAIAALDPAREAFLEYEITRLIYELENPDRVRVALITALPIDPSTEAPQGMGGVAGVFASELGRTMDVTVLGPDFTSIPAADVLAIIHPPLLSPQQLYAVDQFILRNGRAFIALDPASLMAEQSAGADAFGLPSGAQTASSLGPLLQTWGVVMTPGVVLDAENALPVNTQDPRTGQPMNAPQPLFFLVPPDGLDQDDLMTAWLARGINFGLAGTLAANDREGLEVTPLAQTSGQTMRLSAAEALARPSPFDIAAIWPQGGGRRETVALRLSGNLQSAFPEGAPAAPEAAVDGQPDEAAAPPAPADGAAASDAPAASHLAASSTPAELVIVADVDFLADDFYIAPDTGLPGADNAAFALNAIDILAGSDALVSLRSRAPSLRRMELVERMENDASRRIQRRYEELQAQLQETEARLAELQAHGRGSGFFAGDLGAELTDEERVEVEQFRAQAMDTRRSLRNVERDLRSDINRLKAAVLFVNIWMAPLLIAGAGVFLFWRRQRRGRARS